MTRRQDVRSAMKRLRMLVAVGHPQWVYEYPEEQAADESILAQAYLAEHGEEPEGDGEMIKRDELSNPDSCMSRARDDEATFVLLGRDVTAAATVQWWINKRVEIGKNKWTDPQIVEAVGFIKTLIAQAKDPDLAKALWTAVLQDADRTDRYEAVCGSLGLHPETELDDVLDAIQAVRSDARNYPDLQLIIGDLRRKLAEAGVEGSPPPGGQGTIPMLMSRAQDAERQARALEEWKGEQVQALIKMSTACLNAGFKGDSVVEGVKWMEEQIRLLRGGMASAVEKQA